jgi:hypothetical protein
MIDKPQGVFCFPAPMQIDRFCDGGWPNTN